MVRCLPLSAEWQSDNEHFSSQFSGEQERLCEDGPFYLEREAQKAAAENGELTSEPAVRALWREASVCPEGGPARYK